MTGPNDPRVDIAPNADELAARTARRAVAALAEAVGRDGEAHLVVTGGGILEQTLAALVPATADSGALDWQQVHVWWGDERYVETVSDDRNDRPARAKAFDHLDMDPGKIHPMPSSDAGFGDDVEGAADSYAAELAAFAPAGDDVPRFAVILLGLGPDGHCASLFPDRPEVAITDASVVAVRNSPKPPPIRLSLTVPALDAADQIWFVASGDGKADAVGQALGGADPAHVPSAAPRGLKATLWLLDTDAAAQVPDSVARLTD